MSSTLDFVCGIAAGWSQIVTGQPLDYIKTKYQVSKTTNSSAISFAKQIIKDHGVLGFYRGSSSLFFGFSFTIALQFAIYQFCKKEIQKRYDTKFGTIPQQILSLKQIFLSGGIVGLFVSFVYCPVEYAKIQKQIISKNSQSSLTILFKELYKNKFENIYRGFTATIMRQTIGSAFYYASYQNAVRQLCKYQGYSRKSAQYTDYLIAGATAGLSFWTVSYPFDVIKTKLQMKQGIRQIIRNLPNTAYRGFSIIALRSVIVNGFSFATFQQAKRLTQMFSLYAE